MTRTRAAGPIATGPIAIGLVAAGVVAASWWLWRAPPGLASPHALRPDDAALTARGAALYRQHCAACHGAALEGQPNWQQRSPQGLLPAPPHDASGHTWHHPDEQLFRLTKEGVAAVIGQPDYRTSMPVYGGVLSDEDIVAVLSWIKAQWPAEVRERHDEINRRARGDARR